MTVSIAGYVAQSADGEKAGVVRQESSDKERRHSRQEVIDSGSSEAGLRESEHGISVGPIRAFLVVGRSGSDVGGRLR